ncbi:MAG TPA: amino acid adenylation domain-containing protein [Pseudonocardiaceae bacterium]|nr:amino acid adenylation domain-containing protein [Pseudonocardiaceae bacterium]
MTGAGGVHGLPSAREVARARLAAQRNIRAGALAGVPRRPDPATAPLSPEQQGLWFIEQLGGPECTAGAYNVGQTLRLTGPLDVTMLRQALADVVDRHEALRTRIVERDGRPIQLIAERGDPSVVPRLDVIDVRALPPEDGAADSQDALAERAEHIAARLAAAPFRLDEAPMLRLTVLRLSETDHLVHVGAHHLICDGQGMMIVVEELGACYDARVRGRVPALPRLTVHFPDYAHWQHQRLAGELGERQRAYWAEQLADAPTVLDLPTDRPRPVEQTFASGRKSYKGVRKIADKVTWFAAKQHSTVPMLLLAALSATLTRYSGQTDIVIGMPVARRTRELQGAVGMFANTVALRIDTSGNPTVPELLGRVRKVCMAAFENADLSFEAAAATVQRERNVSHNPLFQVMYVPGDAVYDAITDPQAQNLQGRPVQLDRATAVVDLTWVAQQDTMATYVDYNTDLFDPETIEQFGWHVRRVIDAMILSPQRRIWDLPMLTDAEHAHLSELGRGAASGSAACVVEGFVRQAARTPDAVAVRLLDVETVPVVPAVPAVPVVPAVPIVPAVPAVPVTPARALTYRELEARSRSVANRLRQLGCGSEHRVGLLLPAGVDAVVTVLGVLRAGAAYVPLDRTQPPARAGELLADSGAAVLVTDGAPPPGYTGTVLATSDPAFHGAEVPGELPPIAADQLAYVIYTSGSEGEPKGVMVEHGSLRNLTAAFRAEHGLGPRHRLLAVPPLSFDGSVGCLFPALTSGLELVLHPDPAVLTGTDVLALAREHGITALNCPSPLWQRWVADLGGDRQPDTPLSLLMIGGDRIPIAAVGSWIAATGGAATLFNHYGPTEATVCGTLLRYTPQTPPDGAGYLPIGRPIQGVTAHVLDPLMRPAPPGVPGELYLGGAAPARGYLGRDAETAQRYVPDPFSTEPGARLYRTGDLARFRRDGLLEFVGRRDGQVKIRGHRVELAEVESVLIGHPSVDSVAVVAQPDHAGFLRLVAYVVAGPPSTVAGPPLREFALARLPGYLVPSVFVTIDRLPMTARGKVDRGALPPVDELLAERSYVPPRTDTEHRLAAIWSSVLGIDRIGVSDNFFELGGHSLLAATVMIQVRAMIPVRAQCRVSLPIRTLFDTADLAELAGVVDEATGAPGAPAPLAAPPAPDLRAAAMLPGDVRAACARLGAVDSASALQPANVLLTGATGFLGAYLLADLLANTTATVYCLVRASSAEVAAKRVRANLEQYGLWRAEHVERVAGLPGDLGAPRLGLTAAEFDELAGELDVIYHGGGAVSFVQPYRQLAPANVGGTVEVLRLAARCRATPVHLVSTLGVFLGGRHAGATVTETDEPDPAGLTCGYDQSKWVGDALARRAREYGLPVSIYRPARVAGDGRTGAGNYDDYFSRLLRTVVALGAVPAADTVPPAERHADLAPVDHVAAAIGALSRMPHALGRNFHLHNPRTLSLEQFTRTLREFGYDVRELPAQQWQAAVVDFGTPLSVFAAPDDLAGSQPVRPVFDCHSTEALLAEAGLFCPPADGELLRRYLAAFVGTGYLPTPRKAG